MKYNLTLDGGWRGQPVKLLRRTLLTLGISFFFLGVGFGAWDRFQFNRRWSGPILPFYAGPIWPMMAVYGGILLIIVGYRMGKKKVKN
jgi:hypothetical protein